MVFPSCVLFSPGQNQAGAFPSAIPSTIKLLIDSTSKEQSSHCWLWETMTGRKRNVKGGKEWSKNAKMWIERTPYGSLQGPRLLDLGLSFQPMPGPPALVSTPTVTSYFCLLFSILVGTVFSLQETHSIKLRQSLSSVSLNCLVMSWRRTRDKVNIVTEILRVEKRR